MVECDLRSYTVSIIIAKECLQAILAAVDNPDFDCEETLEKVKVAANTGLDHLNNMLDAIQESGDRDGAER